MIIKKSILSMVVVVMILSTALSISLFSSPAFNQDGNGPLQNSSDPGLDAITFEFDQEEMTISPLGRRKFDIKASNQVEESLQLKVSTEDTLDWEITNVDSIGVGPSENVNLSITVDCPIDASLGVENNLDITVEPVGMEHLSRAFDAKLQVQEDSEDPQISEASITPEEPTKGEKIEVQVSVTDNEGIENVTIYYHPCTEETCAPTEIGEMNETEDGIYTVTVGPFDENYTDLGFYIKAEDVNQNVNQTEYQEFSINYEDGNTDDSGTEDDDTDGSSIFEGESTMLILLSIIAIVVIIALTVVYWRR